MDFLIFNQLRDVMYFDVNMFTPIEVFNWLTFQLLYATVVILTHAYRTFSISSSFNTFLNHATVHTHSDKAECSVPVELSEMVFCALLVVYIEASPYLTIVPARLFEFNS